MYIPHGLAFNNHILQLTREDSKKALGVVSRGHWDQKHHLCTVDLMALTGMMVGLERKLTSSEAKFDVV